MTGRNSRQTRSERGLDHDLFEFRTLRDAAEFNLPDGGSVAVAICLVLQDFSLAGQPPFPVPGALSRPYPDIGNFSQRQVGTTDGLWRLVDAIERQAVCVSFVAEQAVLPKITEVHPVMRDERHAVVASGRDATSLITPATLPEVEAAIVRDGISSVQEVLGRTPIGWRSPYCSQSPQTVELLAEAGIRYTGDFSNDDRPYRIRTSSGPLLAMPMNHFFSDLNLIHTCRQTETEFFETLLRAARWLAAESTPAAPRVLPVVLHPWLSGTPHRIGMFESWLAKIGEMSEVRFVSTDALFRMHAS